jgi:Transcriptional Coactivator p15 (PC4)
MSTEEPKQKKVKVETLAAAAAAEDDDRNGTPSAAQRNETGEAFFELSNMRRVTVREFKGHTLIDIREVRCIGCWLCYFCTCQFCVLS